MTFRYGIYREPGRAAQARRRQVARMYALDVSPRPKRVGTVEAKSEQEALTKFAEAEVSRSRHVIGWELKGKTLLVHLANGMSEHTARFWAGRTT